MSTRALFLILFLAGLFPQAIWVAKAENGASIVALVNDEPISNHDVDMRIKLALANSPEVKKALQRKLKEASTQVLWRQMIEKYRPTSREEAEKLQVRLVRQLQSDIQTSMKKGLRKKILEELIEERIQLQTATKLGLALTDEDLNERLDQIAKNNKSKSTGKTMTGQEFSKAMEAMGVPVAEFRNRMKARGSWIRVVRSKFQYQVNIGDQDVDRMISDVDDKDAKMQTIYTVQRVRLPISVSASETKKAAALIEAETLRQSVTSCSQLEKAVSRFSDASVNSLGSKRGDNFPNALQLFLASTENGRLTPATLTSSGVELYAVCGRKQKKMANLSKRNEVKEQLRQQEFEILARRYMQDLRQEASIEYR